MPELLLKKLTVVKNSNDYDKIQRNVSTTVKGTNLTRLYTSFKNSVEKHSKTTKQDQSITHSNEIMKTERKNASVTKQIVFTTTIPKTESQTVISLLFEKQSSLKLYQIVLVVAASFVAILIVIVIALRKRIKIKMKKLKG